MKGKGWLYIGLLAGAMLTLGFILTAPSQQSLAEFSTVDRTNGNLFVVDPQVDGSPTPPPDFGLGSDELAPAQSAAGGIQAAAFVLPTPIPGEALVYFVPTDNDATATVLYLYNTDTVSHVVALRGFNYDGAMVYAQNININASSFLRLVSDSVAAAPPPSWATPAPITTNFTDFVYFASLSLPRGVKVEGYTLFNPGTGVVNPRLDQGAIPLRFSTDPATVFLPAVQK